MELIRKCVDENAHIAQDQDEYNQRREGLVARYETTKGQLDGVNDEKQARIAKRESMKQFIADLNGCSRLLKEFDEPLWYVTVETVTVSQATVAFTFKDGTVIEVNLI